MKAEFECGDELKERVTGLTGIVMGITKYSTGCIHYGILSRKAPKDANETKWHWFDESRLDLVKSKAVEFGVMKETTGKARVRSGSLPNAPSM